jgi:sulfite exporter TauE/SafE
MFLFEPLTRRLTRDEVNRLILSDQRRLSTYVLMGLAFGGLMTAFVLLEQLHVTRLVFILFMVGALALVMLGRLQARRLAKQLTALRRPPT